MTLVPAPGELRNAALAGNKFARLETMREAGLPVPPFFCVSVRAFDELMESCPLPAADDVTSWCRAARHVISAAAVPGELTAEILKAFDELLGGGALAAVRACVVPADGDGEDGTADPFAGMSESFLYVPRDRLVARVRDCWASAFKPEAVAYRLHRGVNPAGARVAVGIQAMVPGVRSFVAFTRDPRDGGRRQVIAAAHGIGEGVVAEKADVDHFFVDAGGRCRAEITQKKRMVGPPAGDSPAPAVRPVPAALADVPVLTDDEVRRIAALGDRVEELFGGPQDIEGAMTEDGSIQLVQARPIVLRTPLRWSNHNLTESYPGVSSALTYSHARQFYRSAFGDLYRRMGVSRRRLPAHHLDRMVGLLNGRAYYRLDAWYALHGRLPIFPLIRSSWEEAMGLPHLATGPERTPIRAILGAAVRAVTHPREVREFLRWWDALMSGADALETMSPAQLVTFYRRLWTQVSGRWGVTLTNSMYLLAASTLTNALLRRWTGDPSLLAGLLTGGPENRSLMAVRAAAGLAERAAAVPGLAREIRDCDADTDPKLWQAIVDGRYGAAISDAATGYVRRFGDRALHDLKLDEPTPRQRPWMVLALLRPYLQAPGDHRETQRRPATARSRLRAACPGRIRRSVLLACAGALRWTIRAREDTRFCRTQLFGLSRQVMWRLGTELAASGRLERADDVADLTVDEVLGAFEGTLPGSDLRALARHRSRERRAYEAAPAMPPLLSTDPGPPVAEALRTAAAPAGGPADGAATLRGLGSSAGRVRGRARVILEPAAGAEPYTGEILVARETDPGWLFLMMTAGGLVVERGTMLSHTAITGRLLGIPTVVAVEGATTRIPDGAWIEIDGSAGTVHIEGASP